MSQELNSYTKIEVIYSHQSDLQRLDLYRPTKEPGPYPLVIWIHGGGFRVGDKRSMPHVDHGPPPEPTGPMGPYQIQVPDVEALTKLGFAVVSLNYRLGRNMREAGLSAVQDGKTAIRYLRSQAQGLNIDPDRFAAWGNSAGGYMAAMLGLTGDQSTVFDGSGTSCVSSAVQAVIVWFGAEDRLPGPLKLTHYISGSKIIPPFLIANGDRDPIIPGQQAMQFDHELKSHGVDTTLTIIPGAKHEDPLFMQTQMEPAIAFLQRTLAR